MSLPAPSELDPLLTRQDHRQLSCCCKLSYKPRKFSSKGAVLVLVWQFLVFCGALITKVDVSVQNSRIRVPLESATVIAVVLVAIISGWLADTKVGRSKVVQTGLFLTWLGVFLENVCITLAFSVHTTSNVANGTIQTMQYVAVFTAYVGIVVFFPNVLQFGLEQMPDASTDAMIAFISWFTIATALGLGSYETVRSLFSPDCYAYENNRVIRAIIGCVLLSIAMCSKILFSHWLIDHRQNHHPLKTVYQVLKFAKQHKYPVNRSAFTYCEEEIPSRIDLGKSKYGGPFTTEEVEDVKTFFRILTVLTVIFLFTAAVFLITTVPLPHNENDCFAKITFSFKAFFVAVVFLTYDYIVYPCFKIRCCRLSMLKIIGLCLFSGVLLAVVLLVYVLLTDVGLIGLNSIIVKGHHSIVITVNWLTHVIIFICYRSILQFIYSQAPEHMKGFLLTWIWVAIGIILAASDRNFLNINCSQHKYCGVYLASAAVAFSLLVFVVYCRVARWYKRRERDEPCNERAIIEEIYGRHVEHNSIEASDSN